MPLLAQTNEEVFSEYQFNFLVPGARAIGTGGAFIGLADDASSSFTNPAGLAYLREPALTLEYRHKRADEREGNITGNINFNFVQEARTLEGISFAAINFRLGGWYFGLYEYQFLDEFQERQFVARSFTAGVESIDTRNVSLELDGTTRGFGIARRFGKFKLGISANFDSMRGLTSYSRVHLEITPNIRESRYLSEIDDKDEAWGYHIGLLYAPNDRMSWGLVYRNNPVFNLRSRVQEIDTQRGVFLDFFDVPFLVPDVIGGGFRYRVTDAISLLADWQHIQYSQIVESGFVVIETFEQDSLENYTTSDINEFHMGAEWLFPTGQSVLALRAGYFANPVHKIEYTGNDPLIRDRFSGTSLEDENHFTFGFGWVFRNSLELDLAANIWEQGKEFTASFIWRKK